MNDTNQEQAGSALVASHLTSRATAMTIPEILSNIFSFLDWYSLRCCGKVSRLWRAHSQPFTWNTKKITTPYFLSVLFGPDGDEGECDDDGDSGKGKSKGKNKSKSKGKGKGKDNKQLLAKKMQHFAKNCSHIRSLVVSDPSQIDRKTPIEFCWIQDPAPLPFRLHNVPSLSRRSECLRNLSSLIFQTALNSPRQLSSTEATNFCVIVGTILSQNPGIQDLEWGMGGELWAADLAEHVLKRASRQLKKLSIVGYFIGGESHILKYLIDANDKQQRRQQQEQNSPREEKLNENNKPMECESAVDEKSSRIERDAGTDGNDDNDTDGDSGGCSELEELVFEAVDPVGIRGPPELNWMWLNDVHGALPIRALTLLNFETDKLIESDDYDPDWPAHQPNGSLMAILSKCPYLEKLCVTFDDPCHSLASAKYRFMDEIRADPHFVRFPCRLILVSEESDFVEKMYERCPRLREIEFGMAYQFTTDHWIEMMRSYGAQLESLSVWGNLSSFNSKAFMTMIGRPISHFARDTSHRLTRLNINGMEHLHECAWMALHQLPQLKEFRARDVPLDARDLAMKDNWTCKGLEVLEIFVLVPKSSQWFWCDSCEEWAKGAMCCRKGVATAAAEDESKDESEDESEDDHENRNGDGQDNVTIGTKRKRKGTSGTRETGKRAREEPSEQTADRGAEKDNTTSMDRKEDFARNQDDRDQSFERYKQVQIRVCEMIGGLTRLRELRIEGQKDFAFSNNKWDCLELTLETGLDHLRPLQQNLETLDVHTLHENLGGQKEVEWIALNWIHYNNPRWLEQRSSTYPTTSSASASSLGGGESEQKGNALMSDNSDNFIPPYPKFRRLCGISEYGVDQNIKWLKEQCPTLYIVNSQGKRDDRVSKSMK